MSMGVEGMYPRMLGELASVAMGLLSIVFKGFNDEEVSDDQKKPNTMPVFRQGSYQAKA